MCGKHVSGGARDAGRCILLAAAAIGLLILVWVALTSVVGYRYFAVHAPQTQVGVEAASALARVFAALVLLLFPIDPGARALRWVAAGLGISALGGVLFGYLPAMVGEPLALEVSMYASIVVRAVSGVLYLIGLLPARPPEFNRTAALLALGALLLPSAALSVGYSSLPQLAPGVDLIAATATGEAPLGGFTPLYWVLSGSVFLFSLAMVWAAARPSNRELLGGWLLVALVLLAGSQLHQMFWPSVYSPVLTTADVLRLGSALAIAVAGVLELRRVAAERGAMLLAEQEYGQRQIEIARGLEEIARMKSEFGAMVAHELSNPVAAIRGHSYMMQVTDLDPVRGAASLRSIDAEAAILTALINDIREASRAELEDFRSEPRIVAVDDILREAAAFAAALNGGRPVSVSPPLGVRVLADPERIGQVLRNLLGNAAKYTPTGAAIELRAVWVEDRVRVTVADRGAGIDAHDLERIFEKFGRGRRHAGGPVPGAGVGLYVSRRIARAHGSDLVIETSPGDGAAFSFELEVVE